MIHLTSLISFKLNSFNHVLFTILFFAKINQFIKTIEQFILIEKNEVRQFFFWNVSDSRIFFVYNEIIFFLKQQKFNIETNEFWNDFFSSKFNQMINTIIEITDYGKKFVNLIKMYIDEVKYSEKNDNFTYKLTIFHDICGRAKISHEIKIKIFSIMLIENALNYYYSHINNENQITFDEICYIIRSNFETIEWKRRILFKWNEITLKFIMINTKNEKKFMKNCFQLLFKKLCYLQHELNSKFHIDRFFHNKLINACQNVSMCQYVCFKSSNNFTNLINDLWLFIVIYHKINFNTKTFFVDKRYYNDSNFSRHE